MIFPTIILVVEYGARSLLALLAQPNTRGMPHSVKLQINSRIPNYAFTHKHSICLLIMSDAQVNPVAMDAPVSLTLDHP